MRSAEPLQYLIARKGNYMRNISATDTFVHQLPNHVHAWKDIPNGRGWLNCPQGGIRKLTALDRALGHCPVITLVTIGGE